MLIISVLVRQERVTYRIRVRVTFALGFGLLICFKNLYRLSLVNKQIVELFSNAMPAFVKLSIESFAQ